MEVAAARQPDISPIELIHTSLEVRAGVDDQVGLASVSSVGETRSFPVARISCL
jgi:hypothetical protein